MNHMKNRIKIHLLIAVHVFFLLLFPLSIQAADAPFQLHLMDVGQGLGVLIKADDHYMLYDGGGYDTALEVSDYLKQQGVSALDLIIASHYDNDHLNGLTIALYDFPCTTLLEPDYQADTSGYDSFQRAVHKSKATVIHPQKGEIYSLGSAQIHIIGPGSYDNPDENDNSIAIRITYKNTSYLLCGDAETLSETKMADEEEISSDVYVVNHHGSSSSSSFYFLNKVDPAFALLSCGADNSYGHPAQETMERLKNEGCQLYRTDLQGTIKLSSDGNNIWFNTKECQDWSSGSSPSEQETEKIPEDTTYVCNINSKKFHRIYCDTVKRMREENKQYTSESRETLIAEGYTPCKNCNP